MWLHQVLVAVHQIFDLLAACRIFSCDRSDVKLLSHVQLFAIPWTIVHQAPPSMGFSRQEYWSGVPLPSLPGYPTDHQINSILASHGARMEEQELLGRQE